MAEIFSSHTFLYPFRWDYYQSDKNANSLENRLDIKKIKEALGSKWQTSTYHLQEPLEYYNDATYLYEFTRQAIFSSGVDQIVHNMEYAEKELQYNIETLNGNFILDVSRIQLNIYDNGIAVLGFFLDNNSYEQPDDILKINDFGRRIYPQFLDAVSKEQNENKNILEAAQKAFLAKKISIAKKGQTELHAFNECFKAFSDKDTLIERIKNTPQNLPHSPASIAGFLSGEKKTIVSEIYDDSLENILIRPILDDRMYVITWFGNDSEIEKLKVWDGSNRSYSYNNYDASDFFGKFIFVDNSDNSCMSKSMRPILMAKCTYDRWIEYGTLFGFSRYSFVCLTGKNDFAEKILRKHVTGIYFQMAQLVLVQRASLVRFSDETTAISGKNHDEIEHELDFLHKLYMRFRNKLYFKSITSQEQGIDFYKRFVDAMEIEKELQGVNTEIDELHQYVNTKLDSERNKEALNLSRIANESMLQDIVRNKEAHNLSIIASFFASFSIVFGILGANFFSEKLSWKPFSGWDEISFKWIMIGSLISIAISFVLVGIIKMTSKKS